MDFAQPEPTFVGALKYIFSLTTLIKIGVLLLGAIVPGILMFVVPSTPYAVSNLFGALLPSLLLGFALFGPCPFFLFRIGRNLDQISRNFRARSDTLNSEKLVVYMGNDGAQGGSLI